MGPSPRVARLGKPRVARSRAPVFRPQVVMLLPDNPSRGELLRALGKRARVTLLDGASAAPKSAPIDIALIHAGSLSLSCGPLLHDADLGFPELVFVVEEAWSPQHLALGTANHAFARAGIPFPKFQSIRKYSRVC